MLGDPAAAQTFRTDFERTTGYVYDTYEPFRTLSFTVGCSYDALLFPENYRQPPIGSTESSVSRFSPKAGVTWNPVHNLIFRAAYARALGGVSFDESILLEPTQISGFNQVFRTIIPEALVGSVAAPKFENAGLSVEEKFGSGTYLGLQATVLHSNVERTRGDFEATIIAPPAGIAAHSFQPNSLSEHLSYTEKNVTVTANQLLGECWSFGGRYQLSDSTLRQLRRLSRTADPTGDTTREGILHQLDVFALFNHPSGFFARCDAIWYDQTNTGYGNPGLPGDDFWQFNLYGGYRFRRNRAEIMLGFLNITDRNYRLNPLNLHEELPRERALFARLRLDF